MTDGSAARALSFGAAADAYERSRPQYPGAAVAWLVPASARRVVDVGAGTGKLTRQLFSRGREVVAVEPSEGMRNKLRSTVRGATVLAGTAEEIPLPDGSVDAVVVAQAWHWVDPARAIPEVARVLAPGGTLGLLWNVRDDRDPWVAALSEVMHRFGASNHEDVDPTIGPPFRPMERLRVPWAHRLSRDSVLDLVASRSYVITMTPERRAELFGEVRRLADSCPPLPRTEDVAIPYVTHCSRTQLW